jgi:hypothetical protein
MIALAIADNAFENKFTSLAQIYNLTVPSTTDRIRLKWDKDWAERPIFRDVEKTPGYEDSTSKTQPIFEDDKDRIHDALLENARKKTRGGKGSTRHGSLTSQDAEKQIIGGQVRISKKRSLSYQKHRHYFVRLGRTCRYRKKLQWYDWRRASGKKMNGNTPLPRSWLIRNAPRRHH